MHISEVAKVCETKLQEFVASYEYEREMMMTQRLNGRLSIIQKAINYSTAEKDATIAAQAKEIERLRMSNGLMRGQIGEAIAILRSGTDYEKSHIAEILEAAEGIK